MALNSPGVYGYNTVRHRGGRGAGDTGFRDEVCPRCGVERVLGKPRKHDPRYVVNCVWLDPTPNVHGNWYLLDVHAIVDGVARCEPGHTLRVVKVSELPGVPDVPRLIAHRKVCELELNTIPAKVTAPASMQHRDVTADALLAKVDRLQERSAKT